MKRKDFRKAAEIIKGMKRDAIVDVPRTASMLLKIDICKLAYIALFRGELLFDEKWFIKECESQL